MKKVITYGTYDLLHYGHIRLLERAKALGDYLIVAVTSDDYDKSRGKINVKQSVIERIENVRNTGLADEIIIEEYAGQKIDDINKYNVDIFAIGSDWKGQFDYLEEYCKVVYLDRTEGISSTEIRNKKSSIKFGLVGDSSTILKFESQVKYVNGLVTSGFCVKNESLIHLLKEKGYFVTKSFDDLLDLIDAVYILATPQKHYDLIKRALLKGKHVLCESPLALTSLQAKEIFKLAKEKKLIVMEALKTAHATAYHRLLLLAKGGIIGKVVSVDATCTSLSKNAYEIDDNETWNSICTWGPTCLLPIFQMLGTKYVKKSMVSYMIDSTKKIDGFTKINFIYDNAIASLKVGKSVKSEGELIISGTNGCIYVPSPWWKTDYFEVHYENINENKRYFYQLDGEGIRNELLEFVSQIENGICSNAIDEEVSIAIAESISDFYNGKLDEIKCN